jgi:hypothetical protein
VSLDWIASAGPQREEGPEPAARGPRRTVRRDGNGSLRAQAGLRAAPPTEPTDIAKDQWVSLGPTVTLRGGATLRPRIAGRCRAIAVSQDGRRIYAGTAQGGTWFSGDGGEHWLPLDFFATTPKLDGSLGEATALAVGSIAVRFGGAADGSQDDVYVGTGEQRFNQYSPLPAHVQGVGIRTSTGPGPTVQALGPTATPWRLEATNLAGAAVLRLLVEQQTGVVWAATSRGLFRRPDGGGDEWEHVDTGLDDEKITDIAITNGEGAEPRRLYVASSEPGLAFRLLTESGGFTPVTLPPFPFAASLAPGPVTRLALAEANVAGQALLYVLGDEARLWRVRAGAAEPVTGLPADLFKTQATYDMAIAVHPTDGDRIVVGGSSAQIAGSNQFDASLYAGPVSETSVGRTFVAGAKTATGLPSSFIGTAVHSDVHDLAWVPGTGGATELWVACDGGIFRSRQDGKDRTFDARNSGLATLEAQYIAQHPEAEGVLLVGTQDNGLIRPLSPETWTVASEGDAGGVALDPLGPHRQITQYVGPSWWTSTDGGGDFNELTLLQSAPSGADKFVTARYKGARLDETVSCSFYCSAAVIANGTTTTQLAVGTDRVWLSTDWGVTWVTIPSGKNPYDPATAGAPDRALDRLDDRASVSVLKWASENALHVLTKDGIYLYSRADSASPWTRARRYNRPQVQRDTKSKTPSGQIPADMDVTDLASHDLQRAGLGSLYASTSGVGDEHVWWFDGQGQWRKTALPVDSPVHSIVVDPAHREVVYAGTDVGVYKGVATIPAPGAGDAKWDWKPYSNALPEAPVLDLVIHEKARLLRAALAGRGVWEVALDGVPQTPIAYMRAHTYDTRRRLPLPTTGPRALDPLADPALATPLRLDASPDLRVYRAVGTAPPPAPTKAWDAFDVWVLQSFLRALGKRIEANGVFDAATQDANLEVGPLPTTAAEWVARFGGPNSNKPAFDHDPPDAADINVSLRDEPDRRTPPKSSCAVGAGAARVWAVVHGRDWRVLPANRVAVFVLRAPFNGKTDLSGLPALPANWATSLRGDLTAATPGAWLAKSGWAYLDPVTPFRRPARAVSPREAQVVQFDVAASAWPVGDWLLLAVVHADDDELKATETDVAALVRATRHVAARSVRRFAP